MPTPTCGSTAPHPPHRVRKVGGRVNGRPGGTRMVDCPGVDLSAILPGHHIVLRPEAFTPGRVQSYGWPSLSAMGDALGVHSATLRRAVQGKTRPGERLVAQLIAGTGHTFDALCAVVPD